MLEDICQEYYNRGQLYGTGCTGYDVPERL